MEENKQKVEEILESEVRSSKKKRRRKRRKHVLSALGICIVLFVLRSVILSRLCPSLTFIGHASVKIKTTTGEVIYIDPYCEPGNYSEPADYILVTHNHYDHNKVSLCKQKEGCEVITADEALTDKEYQTFNFEHVTIKAVPSGQNPTHSGLRCVGYIVTVDGVSIYHAGDTSYPSDESLLVDGSDIDYAMYPIDGVYDMGPEEAARMADAVGAKHNIPIHGNSKHFWEQTKSFNPQGKLRLFYWTKIYLRK